MGYWAQQSGKEQQPPITAREQRYWRDLEKITHDHLFPIPLYPRRRALMEEPEYEPEVPGEYLLEG